MASAAGAVLVAFLALYAFRLPEPLRRLGRAPTGALVPVRRLHSGDVTGYVSWLVAGVALYGVILAALLR